MSLLDSLSATSSPVSAPGATLCDSPDGETTGPSGLVAVPANLSARQAKVLGLMTSGIYGLRGTTSSQSANLQSSLESRLRARLDSAGSTLFVLTWKQRGTPSGLPICALRASARRTSDSGCTSWPTAKGTDGSKGGGLPKNGQDLVTTALMSAWSTPMANDATGGSMAHKKTDGSYASLSVDRQAQLASWPTAAARDWKGATDERWGTNARPLNEVAALAHWATTTTTDSKGSRNETSGRQEGSKHHAGQTLGDQVFGLTATGSPAETAKRGQLNPAHSRWLMGLLRAWDACAPMATRSSRKSLPRSSKRPASMKTQSGDDYEIW